MYSKVFKNYQVNLGTPVHVKNVINMQAVRPNILKLQEQQEEEASVEAKEQKIIDEAREEAGMLLKEAELEAQRMMEDALKEAEQGKIILLEEARQEGYNQGFSEGKMQYEQLIKEAEIIKEQASIEHKELLQGIEEAAVNMIIDIAKKVIGNEISSSRDYILYLVKQAFEKCTNKDSAVLKVSAEDYDYLEQNKENLLSMLEGVGDVEIKKDVSLKPGSCVIETPFGNIDAGIETKMKKIEEVFSQMIGKD